LCHIFAFSGIEFFAFDAGISRKRTRNREASAYVPNPYRKQSPQPVCLHHFVEFTFKVEFSIVVSPTRHDCILERTLFLTRRDDFSKLKRKKGIKKPLKFFRKTSANLLRSNKDYGGWEVLFLGHAPATVEERNYTQAPQKLLNEALGSAMQYGIE
jgi:hypothetical protein